MSKDTIMTIHLDPELRDDFHAAAASEHRPAEQVIQALMRDYVQRARQPVSAPLSVSGFTYEMTVKYEVARDLLNSRRAVLSALIGEEEAKPHPDMRVIETLETQMGHIAIEINQLDVTNESMLDDAIKTYRWRNCADR